jgi:hypothetical protein
MKADYSHRVLREDNIPEPPPYVQPSDPCLSEVDPPRKPNAEIPTLKHHRLPSAEIRKVIKFGPLINHLGSVKLSVRNIPTDIIKKQPTESLTQVMKRWENFPSFQWKTNDARMAKLRR